MKRWTSIEVTDLQDALKQGFRISVFPLSEKFKIEPVEFWLPISKTLKPKINVTNTPYLSTILIMNLLSLSLICYLYQLFAILIMHLLSLSRICYLYHVFVILITYLLYLSYINYPFHLLTIVICYKQSLS